MRLLFFIFDHQSAILSDFTSSGLSFTAERYVVAVVLVQNHHHERESRIGPTAVTAAVVIVRMDPRHVTVGIVGHPGTFYILFLNFNHFTSS